MESYQTIMNGIIHKVCKIVRNIMASAAEADLSDVFINGQDVLPIRTVLV